MALRAITSSGMGNLFRPLTRDAGVIFMLHRFGEDERDPRYHHPSVVEALLEYLRREKYQLVNLATLFGALKGESAPLRHAVAFTIDDGYADHAAIASPLFAAYDCPVTTFVTTGFLDGALWFWWDQIHYVFARTRAKLVSVVVSGSTCEYQLPDDHGVRSMLAEDLSARCKLLPDHERNTIIRTLALQADVPIPLDAPPEYAPMSWDALRTCEARGMSFGPHTVTHPILSMLSERRADEEIRNSWARLATEATAPVPIFAYPNGNPKDFGPRELRLVANAGLTGAVTAIEGFATRHNIRAPLGAFAVPRFPCPDSLPGLIQQVSGLERFKYLMRGVDPYANRQLPCANVNGNRPETNE